MVSRINLTQPSFLVLMNADIRKVSVGYEDTGKEEPNRRKGYSIPFGDGNCQSGGRISGKSWLGGKGSNLH
jgi:hypothetical protein